ncbi:MAG: aminoacyl-tRNA hydrolase [Lachnospiraceae bacterium]|nr:aminoacyl-tRNA hydrolase [Lachnospiraceae bacterium]
MFIIAGLGNPGLKYAGTRHNVGFGAIDVLAERYGIGVDMGKHKALMGKGMIEGQKVVLLKPQTYMNLSGESLREAASYYKLFPEEVLVIYDDINLDVGRLRIREKGSAGGHNGMKSIISCLGSDQFPRIRIGVGDKPPRMDLADYVLGRFPEEELPDVREAIAQAAEAATLIINGQMEQAMNQFNGKKK